MIQVVAEMIPTKAATQLGRDHAHPDTDDQMAPLGTETAPW